MAPTTQFSQKIPKVLSRLILAGIAAVFATRLAQAAPIDFSGIDLAIVSSPAGQNFSYTVGGGPGGGTMNLHSSLAQLCNSLLARRTDPTGMWAFEHSDNLSPATFRFIFDTPRELNVNENETLTAAEINEFILPSGSWSVLSMVNATSSSTGSSTSFTGTTYFGPYGHYSIAGTATTFDLKISNSPAFFGLYGTAISINVVPEPVAAPLILTVFAAAIVPGPAVAANARRLATSAGLFRIETMKRR